MCEPKQLRNIHSEVFIIIFSTLLFWLSLRLRRVRFMRNHGDSERNNLNKRHLFGHMSAVRPTPASWMCDHIGVCTFEPFHLPWFPHVCLSLACLQCKINAILHVWKRSAVKRVWKCGGSMRNWIDNCGPTDATVCRAGSRTGLTTREVTNAWREGRREAWCDASLLLKFRAKLFPACSLLAYLLPWQRCMSLKCTLNSGGTGTGGAVCMHTLHFDIGRMCESHMFFAVLIYCLLYFCIHFLCRELINRDPSMFPIYYFLVVWQRYDTLPEKLFNSMKVFIHRGWRTYSYFIYYVRFPFINDILFISIKITMKSFHI